MTLSTFYTTLIGGRRFEGMLSADRPYIACGCDGVALGSCTSIEWLTADVDGGGIGTHHLTDGAWWMAKYSHQSRISLDGLTDAERRQLADEFGIRVGHRSPSSEHFWESEAFLSLASSTKKSARVAKTYRKWEAYLPGWYDAARAAIVAHPE
jgi:hypothetical protein